MYSPPPWPKELFPSYLSYLSTLKQFLPCHDNTAFEVVSPLLTIPLWAIVFIKIIVLLSLVKYDLNVKILSRPDSSFCLWCFLDPRTIARSASEKTLLLTGVYLATGKGCLFLFCIVYVLIKETVGFS